MSIDSEGIDYPELAKQIVLAMNKDKQKKRPLTKKQTQSLKEVKAELAQAKLRIAELEDNDNLLRATINHLNFKLHKKAQNGE
jgi:hypothetical protein